MITNYDILKEKQGGNAMYHGYNMEKIRDHIRTCPKKKFILDTDTFNEIDDQYAIAYMLRSSDRLNVKTLYAAPLPTPCSRRISTCLP